MINTFPVTPHVVFDSVNFTVLVHGIAFGFRRLDSGYSDLLPKRFEILAIVEPEILLHAVLTL